MASSTPATAERANADTHGDRIDVAVVHAEKLHHLMVVGGGAEMIRPMREVFSQNAMPRKA